MNRELWLAPLRGVTIRAFREAFVEPIREAGFCGAFAPFIPANPGIRVNDRMLADLLPFPASPHSSSSILHSSFSLVPQVISKDPSAMRELLKGFKARGFDRADLNAGCPFPMIRRRGRGSGLMRAPDVLERLLEAGCGEMGPGKFSLKIRLGLERPDELRALMPIINRYPLAVLTVHARTAKQMYEGACDQARLDEIEQVSTNPVMRNGDIPVFNLQSSVPNLQTSNFNSQNSSVRRLMIGRSFIRSLGTREDASELVTRYIEISRAELSGDNPVLGRMKELFSYWNEAPRWRRLWPVIKICRTVDELLLAIR